MMSRFYGSNASNSTMNTSALSDPNKSTIHTKANEFMPPKNQQSTNTQQTSSSTTSKNVLNSKKSSKLAIIVMILSLCLGGAIVYQNYTLKKQSTTIKNLEKQIVDFTQNGRSRLITDFENKLSDNHKQQELIFNLLEKKVNQEIIEQHKNLQELAVKVNDNIKFSEKNIHHLNERLSSISPSDNSIWLISQADYLVNLAGRKIWNDQDFVTARLLLKNADESLAQANDPSLNPARQAISKDIASLSSIHYADTDGIIINLMNLSNIINNLPLINKTTQLKAKQDGDNSKVADTHDTSLLANKQQTNLPDKTTEPQSEEGSTLAKWSSNLAKSAESFLSKFIVFENKDIQESNFTSCLANAGNDEMQIIRCQILKKPITAEQSLYLRENIHFQLLIATEAIPRHQTEIYQQSLKDVINWVNVYFDANDQVVKSFLAELKKLEQQPITNTNIPEKLASLPELEKLMQTRVRSFLDK